MKRVYRTFIYLLAAVFFGISCQPEQPTSEPPSNNNLDMSCFDHYYTSYVYSYHIADSLYLVNGETNECRVFFKVSEMITQSFNKAYYDSLNIKHNDTAYNSWIKCHWQPFFPHNYLSADIRSITITSNADFDEQHLAGTSLNDIVQFMAYTPYPFIQSGYKGKSDTYYTARLDTEITHIIKPVSQCTREDFILTLGYKDNAINGDIQACSLAFSQNPSLSQQHTITVTLLDDAGNTWQASIDMDWTKN